MRNVESASTTARATVYSFFILGYRAIEFRDCSWTVVPYAQCGAAVEIIGAPKRARIPRRIRETGPPGGVILLGWGIQNRKARHAACQLWNLIGG
jgi:hypothetical protein